MLPTENQEPLPLPGAGAVTRGTYRGPLESLKGKTALLRPGRRGLLLAQFDDRTLTHNGFFLGFDWHLFDPEDFELLGDLKWEETTAKQYVYKANEDV